MSTLKVSTISPLGTDATKTITIGSAGDTAAGVFTNTPAFKVDKSSDQSITAETWTKVTFTNEYYDTDSAFTDSRFTVPTNEGGTYTFSTMLRCTATNGTAEMFSLAFYKSGNRESITNQIQTADNQLKNSHICASATFNLSAGQYIEVYANINGTSPVIGGSGTQSIASFFTGYKLIGA